MKTLVVKYQVLSADGSVSEEVTVEHVGYPCTIFEDHKYKDKFLVFHSGAMLDIDSLGGVFHHQDSAAMLVRVEKYV